MTKRRYGPLDLVKPVVVDQNAVTISELCKQRGLDRNMAYILRDDMLEQRLWEQVKKRGASGKLTVAYRLTRKGAAAAAAKRKEEESDGA